MPEPNSSSAGILWVIKTYGFKVLGIVAAGALLVSMFPAKTFRENLLRYGTAVFLSMLFGDTVMKITLHHFPWLFDGPQDPARMAVYAATGAFGYAIIGFVFRAFEAGTANPMKILELIRGQK